MILKHLAKAGAIAAFLFGVAVSTQASASVFDIVVNFIGDFSTTQTQAFNDAEVFWESRITGYQGNIDIPQLTIDASLPVIDGVNGILGQAGFTTGTAQNGFALPTAGIMEFDIADVINLQLLGSFGDVILHEMAHVIGFGVFWDLSFLEPQGVFLDGPYVNGSGQYTGAAGLAAYQAEFDPNATFVPVDIVSGPGTADGHWDENWAGGSDALMTGFLLPGSKAPVSNTTIQSFVDLGYTVASDPFLDELSIVPLPAALPLYGTGLAMMGFIGWRRKRRAAT